MWLMTLFLFSCNSSSAPENIMTSSVVLLTRSQADYDYLMAEQDKTFSTLAFLPDVNTKPMLANNVFEGKLTISGNPTFSLNYGALNDLPLGYQQWPDFSYEFIQDNGRLIPVDRGHGFVGDGAWSITAGVGAVWDEVTDDGYSRAAFPYTIKENNANCEVNGLATFLFKNDGSISKVHIQNVAETCKFYGFEFYGTLNAQYEKHNISNKTQVITRRNKEEAGHFPTKPLTELAIDYPGVELANYAYAIAPEDLNGYSVLVNGTSYIAGCTTRYGNHPYCSEKTIGLYSFTKSIHGFMVVAAIEKQYPGFKSQLIKGLVPECSDSRWDKVTVEHALDMATGNYQSPIFQLDEASKEIVQHYFLPTSRKVRANFACNGWPKQVSPGTYSVYHTTDTELVGYAATAYVKLKLGDDAEAFNDILVPLYDELNLSHYLRGIQRTSDTNDAWGGYGLSATVNDVIRIAQYIRDEAIDGELLDATMVSESLTPQPQGLPLNGDYLSYNNGFWRLHVGTTTKMSVCGAKTQIPMMSGFGGHALLILPEVIVTQFTDSGALGMIETVNDIFSHISNSCP